MCSVCLCAIVCVLSQHMHVICHHLLFAELHLEAELTCCNDLV